VLQVYPQFPVLSHAAEPFAGAGHARHAIPPVPQAAGDVPLVHWPAEQQPPQ